MITEREGEFQGQEGQRETATGSGSGSVGPVPRWSVDVASLLGHQMFAPIRYDTDGTNSDRTTVVSSRTPKATMKAIWARKRIGRTPRAAKVAASTTPALVITPPVTASPLRMPGLVPSRLDSSLTRVMRKIE